MISKTCRQSAIASHAVIPFHFTAKKHGVITLFTVASIVATEKRPLSYQTPQSVRKSTAVFLTAVNAI